ncbi:MAG: hypothetical protein E6J91_07120 [Deltaproteobacteria bacterium]|nr:MAG: hypothetical protein E6J91_07120 [Deltaproteobacteria bacterium]
MELAAVAHPLLDRVGPDDTDALAAVLEAGLGVGAAALLVGLARPAVGLAHDVAGALLAGDALHVGEPLVEAHQGDEHRGRGQDADDELEGPEALDGVRDGAVEGEHADHLEDAGQQQVGAQDRGVDDRPDEEAGDPGQRRGRDRLQPAQPDVDDVAQHRKYGEHVQEWHALEQGEELLRPGQDEDDQRGDTGNREQALRPYHRGQSGYAVAW